MKQNKATNAFYKKRNNNVMKFNLRDTFEEWREFNYQAKYQKD